jgi:hypothetical protein
MKTASSSAKHLNQALKYLRAVRDDDLISGFRSEQEELAIAFAAIIHAAKDIAKHLHEDDIVEFYSNMSGYPQLQLEIKAALDNYEEMTFVERVAAARQRNDERLARRKLREEAA